MKRWTWTLLVVGAGCGNQSLDRDRPEGATSDPNSVDPNSVDPNSVAVLPENTALESTTQLLQLPVPTTPMATVAVGAQPIVAERRPPPLEGGTMTTISESVVAISDPARDLLYFVDLDSAEPQPRTVPLPEGSQPTRIVVGSLGRVHVVLRGNHQIATVDIASGQPLAFYEPCALPRGIDYSTPLDHLYVSCAGGSLVELDASGTQTLREVQLQHDLRDVVVIPDGLWVSTFKTAEAIQLDAGLTVQTQARPQDGRRPNGFNRGEVQLMTPEVAWRAVSSPVAQQTIMLHQRAQSTTLGVAYYGTNCSTSIVETTISVFNPHGVPVARAALTGASLAVDVSVTPDNQWFAVASPGNFKAQSAGLRQLMFVSNTELAQSTGQSDVAPPTCIGQPQAEHLFPGELTSVLFLDNYHLVGLVRQPAELHVMDFDPARGVASLKRIIDLDARDVTDTGHLLFHQAPAGGVSCASCHPGGAEDGHVWEFPEFGTRRTQTLQGGVLKRAPFHWNAELPDFASLMVEIVQNRMRSAVPTAELQATLASWLDALPSERQPASDPAAVARGATLFASTEVGCAECHQGADFSSSELYDIGTNVEFALKAPTLLGVGLRSPLMHDGCAKTLSERFDPVCGGSKHGQVAQLSPSEQDDLIAFLESL